MPGRGLQLRPGQVRPRPTHAHQHNVTPPLHCRSPPPRPLTCAEEPCPRDQQCCEYGGQYTCCAPGQACSGGFCQ